MRKCSGSSQHTKLGSLVRIRTGKLDANANDPEGDFPFFTCAVEPLRIASYSYDCECVLIAGNGDLNVKYYSGKFDAYQRTYIIESLNPAVLNVRFLFHFLDRYLDKLRHMSIGGVIKYIKLGNLTDAELRLPPLPEQIRIAAILDQADALRVKRREALAQLDSLAQSIFIEMFGDPAKNPKGYPEMPFSKVCYTRLGKMLDQKQQTGNHIRKYLRNANVQWFRFDLSEVFEMDFDVDARKVFRLKAGDLLICEGGEPGRAAIWSDEIAECYYQKALHRGRPIPELAVPEYLAWLLWFLAHRGGLSDHVTSATIAHLTGEKLKAMTIPVPPIAIQQAFAQRIAVVDRIKAKHITSLAELDALFSSLQHRAFSGKL